MEIVKNIIDNRYTYAQYIAVPATLLSCLGFYQIMNGSHSTIWGLILILGLFLSLCAYCLGGLLAAIKSSLSIAKWGWLVAPFPYSLATLVFSFVFSLIAFFLMPIIPIRKAYKENM